MKIFRRTALLLIVLLLAGICISLYQKDSDKQQRISELESELINLTAKEKRSAVMQSMNAQMEEIANQQWIISDEQRREAEEQTIVANEQRQQAEIERKNAQIAEYKAVEASKVAQNQREIAEQQRLEAEHSRRIADTLSYVNLGRSLGTLSLNQLEIGNKELANLLGYASYLFTQRYNGDIYNAAVYQALTRNSQSTRLWIRHKGCVTNLDFFSADHLVSVSTYGEIMEHKLKGETLNTKSLFSNKEEDFRDVMINKGDIYAVSRNGHVVVITPKGRTIIQMNELYHPIGITPMDDYLLVVGEEGIATIDPKTKTVVKTKKLPFNIVFYSRYDYSPTLFDDKGNMHIVRSLENIPAEKLPFSGQVTAFASSKNTKTIAYGMKDGSIYLVNSKGKLTKLQGHRSRISKLKINGWHLYSSSYDGTIKMWMCNQAKIDPMELFSTNSWIMNFTFDKAKDYVWTVEQKGGLTEAFISVPMMVAKLKSQLKRNFTREEWNYFIGSRTPYETFIGKEVQQ